MKKILILIVFLSCLQMHLSLKAFGFTQEKLSYELRTGSSFIGCSEVLALWNTGWMIGVGANYRATSMIQLSLQSTYHTFPYSGKNPEGFYPCVIGFRQESSGDNSILIDLATNVRLSFSDPNPHLFLFIRGGLQSFRQGGIRIRTWMEQDPAETMQEYEYQKKGTFRPKGFAAGGLGFEIEIRPSFSVLLESAISTLSDQEAYLPILMSVRLQLS